jgi:hypothetical protein
MERLLTSLVASLVLFGGVAAMAQKPPPKVPAVAPGKDGQLTYTADDRGNRVPDYSYAGYTAGERPIPTAPAKLTVTLDAGADDNARAIQAALDQVAQLPAGDDGIRGAVLLPPGEFKIAAPLTFKRDGVVLRGSGAGKGGTTLVKTGTQRGTILQVRGKPAVTAPTTMPVADEYVPVNATTINVKDAAGLAAGDSVAVTHPGTREWVVALGMDDFGGDRHGPSWRPGSRDITWHRTIAKIDGNALTLDAPLTLGLDAKLATATVVKVDTSGLVRNVGIENLRIISTYDEKNAKDEDHAWFGVGIDNARDVWVRRVTFENLVSSAVVVWSTGSRVTVEDCKNLHPVGEVGGTRRNAFWIAGQQVLMQRLYSENAVHDFGTGHAAAGPNAFVQCESFGATGESGTIESAACGTLFDRVRIDGQALSLRNRTYQGQGVGWSSFNGTLWNSTAPVIHNQKPPVGGNNYAYGTQGEFDGNGDWYGSNDDVNPASLYYAQLGARVGKDAEKRSLLNLPPVSGSRASKPDDAAKASEISEHPRVTVAAWIDRLAAEDPLPAKLDGVERAAAPATAAAKQPGTKTLKVDNGWLTIDGAVLAGGQMGVPWWNGGVRPDDIAKAKPALTRFVPGRMGPGLTDDLTDVANELAEDNRVSVWQHPPLWYERRRDDHQRVQRADGDVVAPFYETPWARSGQGIAADGLSKYDITKPDKWYYSRLREFSDHGSRLGLVLFHGLYMQHNILEAGGHYADFAWRPLNNINEFPLPEPVFFAGDKLIYVAKGFYDISNPKAAELHRAYMRVALEQLADKPNVIYYLSEEYTGPTEFTAFWLDVVAEWEKETGKNALIGLHATKDVVDAILADSKRAEVVDVIVGPFNPGDGGKNLAPRQWQRAGRGKVAGTENMTAFVREYRTKHPGKPFFYGASREQGWQILLGGGSMPNLPETTDPALLKAVVKMKPVDNGLRDDAGNGLVWLDDGNAPQGAKPIDVKTGQVAPSNSGVKLYWITK